MTMYFRALADQAAADGEISAQEVLSLRRDAYSITGGEDGAINDDEADAIFALNDHLKHCSPEWCDFFVEAVTEHLLAAATPPGYITDTQAAWLIGHIAGDQRLESMAELELLEKLFEKAESVPQKLQQFALIQIEQAVLTGDGPTRDGQISAGLALDPGSINAAECRLLRRFIFAPGGDRPAAVSKAEAEMLFRIKDATLAKTNAPEWKQLFVQGVGNYLQGFGEHTALTPEKAQELESFMNDTAVSIGGFFGRMVHSPSGGWDGVTQPDKRYLDFEAGAAEAAAVTDDEQNWLKAQMDKDGQLDELEQALLDFLAEG